MMYDILYTSILNISQKKTLVSTLSMVMRHPGDLEPEL